MTSLDILIDNLYLYILVFVRFAGVILFNPLLSRNNIPAQIRTALALGCALLLTPNLAVPEGFSPDQFELVFAIGRELLVGFLLGYVFQMFYYMLMFAGDILDIQFGFSMAKVMDPATNVQNAFSGNLLNWLFIAYVFVTNSHLLLIHLAATSYDVIPIGAAGVSLTHATEFAISVFTTAFNLAMRLTFPFVVVEFVLEMSLGILMKLIPQIHVFVINMQLKILLAIVLLLLLAKPICVFLDNYILTILDTMAQALTALIA